ncbi:MAG: hypothetical protein WCH01_20460 [Methylococcaceae bacterium]
MGRKKSLRLLSMPPETRAPKGRAVEFRPLSGGFLAQLKDFYTEEEFKPKVVTKRQPSEKEWDDLFFAWKTVKHIKSNGITIVKDRKKEIGPGLLASMLADLDLTKEDLR